MWSPTTDETLTQQMRDDVSLSTAISQWRQGGLCEKILGREKERRALDMAYSELWEAGSKKKRNKTLSSQVVWLTSATPGMGKSTLMKHMVETARRKGRPTVCLDCDNQCDPNPHTPVIRSLSAWAEETALAIQNKQGDMMIRLALRRLQDQLTEEEKAFLSHTILPMKNLLGEGNADASRGAFSPLQQVGLFRSVFAKVVYALSIEGPCLLCVRSVHQGDEVTLNLLSHLLRAEHLREFEQPFMFLGSFCENTKSNPLSSISATVHNTCRQVRRRQIQTTTIELLPLQPSQLSERMRDILLLEFENEETASAFLDFVCWDGMPFFVSRRLELLVAKQWIKLDAETGTWTVKPSEYNCMDGIPNSTSFEWFQGLSESTCQFLRIFSCLGDCVKHELLVKLNASNCLQDDVNAAVKAGVLRKFNPIGTSDRQYGFVHEALQHMIYETIPPAERPRYHYQIAENLWLSFDLTQLQSHMMIVVSHLLKGVDCIPSRRRRAAAAQLCLQMGETLTQFRSHRTSFCCLTSGISLVSDEWESEYQLCLALHSAACEVAYIIARFDDIRMYSKAAISHAHCFTDALRAHITILYTMGTKDDPFEAIAYGDSLLEKVGVSIGTGSGLGNKKRAAIATVRLYKRLRLRGLTIEKIQRMPLMEDSSKLAAMQILNCMVPYVMSADHFMAPIVIEKMITLTLDFGISALSSVGFGYLGAFLCWIGDIENGQLFGNLSLRLGERFRVDAFTGRVATMFYSTTFCWIKPFREAIGPLNNAQQNALSCGDIECALLNANLTCLVQKDILPIPELVDSIREYQEAMKMYGQKLNLQLLDPLLFLLRSCSGDFHGDFTILQEAADRVGNFRDVAEPSSIFQWINHVRAMVCYLFSDFEGALSYNQKCKNLLDYPAGVGDLATPCLLDCLLGCHRLRHNRWNIYWYRRCRTRVKQLRRWAAKSPPNYLGKLHLAEAELASVRGQNDKAQMKYYCAISVSAFCGFYMQTALANELACKHFLRLKNQEMASHYFNDAVKNYREWGGHAKADHLCAEVKL